MSQDQYIVLMYKVVLITGIISILAWSAYYSLTAKWWKNPIGQTVMVMELLVAFLFVPFVLSLFFQLSRLDSRVVAWTDLTLIGLTTPAMCWRLAVWVRFHRAGRHRSGRHDPGRDS